MDDLLLAWEQRDEAMELLEDVLRRCCWRTCRVTGKEEVEEER